MKIVKIEDDTTAAAGGAAAGEASVAARLRAAGIALTLQRLAVAQVMLVEPTHLSADQVLARVRDIMPEVSRATIYNTLRLFAEAGLVKELVIDPERTVFDSNTSHHHHLYEVDTGKLTDIPSGELHVTGTAGLPDDVELEAVDVVLRVRRKPA